MIKVKAPRLDGNKNNLRTTEQLFFNHTFLFHSRLNHLSNKKKTISKSVQLIRSCDATLQTQIHPYTRQTLSTHLLRRIKHINLFQVMAENIRKLCYAFSRMIKVSIVIRLKRGNLMDNHSTFSYTLYSWFSCIQGVKLSREKKGYLICYRGKQFFIIYALV